MPVTKEVQASLVAQTRKESVCNAGNPGSIPGSGRSLGKGNGNPLQYSCLGNPKDRGARGPKDRVRKRLRHNLLTKQEQQ